MLEAAREPYIKPFAQLRLKAAEKAFVPKSPPLSLKYGDKVLAYRDTTGRWEPRTLISRNENTIMVLEPSGNPQPYGITRVSEYKEVVFLPRPDVYGILPEKEIKNSANRDKATAQKENPPKQSEIIFSPDDFVNYDAMDKQSDKNAPSLNIDIDTSSPVVFDDINFDEHFFGKFEFETCYTVVIKITMLT